MRSEQEPPPRQEQRQVHDSRGFPDDDWFLHARAGTCSRCGKQETYAHEFYVWPSIPPWYLYCWDCWERVSGQKLNRAAKPPRKEAAE